MKLPEKVYIKVYSLKTLNLPSGLILLPPNWKWNIKEKKVYDAGDSGFIESAVFLELSKAGHQVVGLARYAETARKNQIIRNH